MLLCLEIFNRNLVLIWKYQKWSLNRGALVSANEVPFYSSKCPFLFFLMLAYNSRLFPADIGGYFGSHFVVVVVVIVVFIFIFVLLLKNVFFIFCKFFCQKQGLLTEFCFLVFCFLCTPFLIFLPMFCQ